MNSHSFTWRRVNIDLNDSNFEREKIKLSTKFGCFFSVILLVLMTFLTSIWFVSSQKEQQLLVDESPNNINTISVVQVDDFPDPTISIRYDGESITKTNIPDKISVEWFSDYKAVVTLLKIGRDPVFVDITFSTKPIMRED